MRCNQVKIILLSFAFVCVFIFNALAQNANDPGTKWEKAILAFEKQDSSAIPPAGGILFIGSSSFTIWKDVCDYFPGKNIINRGFGGSQMSDIIHFKDRLILPYQPKQLVIYVGENDIASGESPRSVYAEFVQLTNWVSQKFPGVRITVISVKPSPIRWALKEKMIELNGLLKNLAVENKNIGFVNIWDAMLGMNGKPVGENFLKDSLHMNANGYRIWQAALAPHLK